MSTHGRKKLLILLVAPLGVSVAAGLIVELLKPSPPNSTIRGRGTDGGSVAAALDPRSQVAPNRVGKWLDDDGNEAELTEAGKLIYKASLSTGSELRLFNVARAANGTLAVSPAGDTEILDDCDDRVVIRHGGAVHQFERRGHQLLRRILWQVAALFALLLVFAIIGEIDDGNGSGCLAFLGIGAIAAVVIWATVPLITTVIHW